jgi:FlaA1/EpsC-like NDP-sugar epimerase
VSEPSSRQATVLAWSRRPAIVALQLVCVALSNWLAFLLRFDWDVPSYAAEIFWRTLPWLVAVRAATFIAFGLDEGLWKYASIYDLRAIVRAARPPTPFRSSSSTQSC